MKKIILASLVLVLAGSQVQKAEAHGGAGPAIAAGVLGGLVVGTAIGAAAAQPTYTYAPAPAYSYYPAAPAYYAPPVAVVPPAPVCPPAPVAYAPAPVVYAPAPTVVYSAPVYYPPVVSFGFGFGRPYYAGHGYYHGHYRRW